MPRYCDVNGDKKITLNEWIGCLQAIRLDITATNVGAQNDAKQQNTSTSKRKRSGKRRKNENEINYLFLII